MPSEKFANLAETTLASGYTSGGASIAVTSASGFPTTGVFRVRLDNANKTIYRVDSVSGTTFTGGAEANDGNANNGAAVVQVISRQALERLIQSPETGAARGLAGVSGADFYGPLWKLGDPTGLAWSWVNQGGSVITDANGISHLEIPSASTSVRSRVLTAPSTPYTITALLRTRTRIALTAGTQYGGLVFRESSTAKLYIFYANANSTLQAVKFTNDTTFGSVGVVNTFLTGAGGNFHWLRVTDDGTNLRFAVSMDGVNFLEVGTEGRTVHMAGGPNEVGFFANVDSAAGGMATSLFSWVQT
jgi:hypothetical protein